MNTCTQILDISVTNCDLTGEIELTALPKRQIILSPNYPHGYPPSQHCYWRIRTRQSYEVVHIHVVESQIQYDTKCEEDFLQVRDGELKIQNNIFYRTSTILLTHTVAS